jgi:L-lactate dehydrogenase complex protein LldG
MDIVKARVVWIAVFVVNDPATTEIYTLSHTLSLHDALPSSATPEVAGNRSLDQVRHPAELDDVDVGVVRALFGVAETGSVWLTETQFKVNTLGFLAQHLVVLLDPAAIVSNLHHAYRDRAQFDARYGVFMTGPSATADIEGILIHGAQGIRTLTIIPVAE